MTRRQFLAVASAAVATGTRAPVVVPVHQVVDSRVTWMPGQLERFQSGIWAQAAGELARCGIELRTSYGPGEVWRYVYREPDISGLDPGALNFVVTTAIPLTWDHGRGLCGVTARYRGRHLCMVALNHAHGHEVPFISVNTCLHEMLHALMLDIFDTPREGLLVEAGEFRIDFYATRLWLFHDGEPVRKSARRYLERAGFPTPPLAGLPACRLREAAGRGRISPV